MTLFAYDCPVGRQCPKIHPYTEADVIVQGDDLGQRDPDRLAALGLPAHEGAVVVPRRLVHPAYVTGDELDAWIDERFTHDLLRIENRRAYAVASDGSDFARFLAGEPEPTVVGPWFDQLDAEHAAGKTSRKAHITAAELSDYERYACAWGYARTVEHHEQVRMTEDRSGMFDDVPDFYVLDGAHVLRMDYADDHRFLGALPITGPDAAVYRALAEIVWSRGVEFRAWWATHPAARRRPHAA